MTGTHRSILFIAWPFIAIGLWLLIPFVRIRIYRHRWELIRFLTDGHNP